MNVKYRVAHLLGCVVLTLKATCGLFPSLVRVNVARMDLFGSTVNVNLDGGVTVTCMHIAMKRLHDTFSVSCPIQWDQISLAFRHSL